jgi:hypothetical protein
MKGFRMPWGSIVARLAPQTPAVVLAALVLATGAPASAAAPDDAERARITAERAAIESRYGDRERECRTRFVVTSCVEDAKRDRRQGLDALRARQLQLDEAKRRQRTAERQAELTAKAAEDARREQERAARAASAPRRETRPFESRHDEVAPKAPARPKPGLDRPGQAGARASATPTGESAAQRQERESRSRAGFETRQRQAAEHRREVERKNAERLKEHPPAASLPVPASMPAR